MLRNIILTIYCWYANWQSRRYATIYEVVTDLGCCDEYFTSHTEACDFARTELCTELFEVHERQVPLSHFTKRA